MGDTNREEEEEDIHTHTRTHTEREGGLPLTARTHTCKDLRERERVEWWMDEDYSSSTTHCG